MTWFEILVIFWAIHAKLYKCSVVIDEAGQGGLFLNDYCPKMQHCADGSHTLCLFYVPGQIAGPMCRDFINITVTNEDAEHMLDIANEMRGTIALGKETGRANVTLPRGYGMFKLKWDKELATIAQVLANTCLLRRDLCRATKKFADPSQIVSLIRFTIPDWVPVLHIGEIKDKGYSKRKVSYAINEVFKSWYLSKQHVTREMIEKQPDWEKKPENTAGSSYMSLIDGKATHIGCGISSYKAYAYNGVEPEEVLFNVVHIICNLSTRPKTGVPLYQLTKPNPIDLCKGKDANCVTRYKSKCGCPSDTAEDDRCLCTEHIPYVEPKPPEPECNRRDGKCKPAVVLLPIFTVDDPPARTKLKTRQGPQLEVDYYEQPHKSAELEENEILSYRRGDESHSRYKRPGSRENPEQCHRPQQYIMNSLVPPYKQTRVVRTRELDSDEVEMPPPHISETHVDNYSDHNMAERRKYSPKINAYSQKKQSIFSKAPKFELHDSGGPTRSVLKMNVAARKDFSKAKQALDKYLNEKKKNHTEPVVKDGAPVENQDIVPNDPEPPTTKPNEIRARFKSSTEISHLRDNLSVIQNITKSLSRRPHINGLSKRKFHYLDSGIDDEDINNDNNNKEQIDKKLMKVLDNLEKEVKNLDLGGSEKQKIDAKIKKIYGSIRKPTTLEGNQRAYDLNLKKARHPNFPEGQFSDSEEDKTYLKQKLQSNFKEEKHSKFKEEKHTNFKEDIPPNYREDIHPNYKEDVHFNEDVNHNLNPNAYHDYKEDLHPDSKENLYHDEKEANYFKFNSDKRDFDEDVFSDDANDLNRNKFDKQMYDTEDMITDLQSKGRDKSLQSLYARPMPRPQNTLRPIIEDKPDYVFRNTFNDVEDLKHNKANKDYKRGNRYRNSIYKNVRKSERVNKNEVKGLPYEHQYKNDDKREKYRILNKYRTLKDRRTKLRPDDEKERNFNRIDEKGVRYEKDIMPDYGEYRPSYNGNNKHRSEDFEKDYPEDPLTADRRRFYQEKLDNLARRRSSSNKGRPGKTHVLDPRRRPSQGRHILGMRRSRANTSRRYYIPNRASRHGY